MNEMNEIIVPDHVWNRFFNAQMTMEQRVMFVMRKFRRPMTPSEINLLGFSETACINSIRSALTRLSNRKYAALEMTDETSAGIWGKPEHYWRLK